MYSLEYCLNYLIHQKSSLEGGFLVTLFNIILSNTLNIITNMYFQYKHIPSLCLTVAVITFVKN